MEYIETKARDDLNSGDIEAISTAFDEFMSALEAFRDSNDERLAALEKRGSVDPLIEERLVRIESNLQSQQNLALRTLRPSLSRHEPEHECKAAMEAYVRKGRTDGYEALERRGMSVGSEADGGYLVPEQTEREIAQAMKADSPFRSLATTLTISTSAYKRPFAVSGAGAGWVAETGLRPETATPQLAELSFPTMELYACPTATKQLLDDGIVDVESWLVGEIHSAFGEQETAAFIAGNGTTMPKGILANPRQPAETATFGNVGVISTGINGGFNPDAPADVLMDLVHSVNAKYRRNSAFLMNRTTLSAVRRLKDEDGNYLWQAKLGQTLETNLLGFPVYECEDMPDIATGAAAIAFGDFRRGYLIVDRQSVQLLRDPYSAKPYVMFYATKRVGGGIMDFNALRLLTFGA